MNYGRGYRTQSGAHCTIMGGPRPPCAPLNFFSSPRTYFMNEPLGIDWRFDNAKLLNQNRFILEEADNENMTCRWGFGYRQDIVDCLAAIASPPDFQLNCDGYDEDYPLFETSMIYRGGPWGK